MRSVSIGDTFGEAGNHYLVMDKYHLSVNDIVEAALSAIAQKSS